MTESERCAEQRVLQTALPWGPSACGGIPTALIAALEQALEEVP